MEKDKEPVIVWECLNCNAVNVSYPMHRHEMDWCKCKQSAVDAEEFYIRQVGNVEILKGGEIYDRREDD